METKEKTDRAEEALLIRLAVRKPKRFKAGAEIMTTVRLPADPQEEGTEPGHFAVDIRIGEGAGEC